MKANGTKPFKGINWRKKRIILHNTFEMRPVEIHLKEDGAIGDRPSFCIILTANLSGIGSHLPNVCGQISLNMFNEGLTDIGYKVVKVNNETLSLRELDREMEEVLYRERPEPGITRDECNEKWRKTVWHRIIMDRIKKL